MAEPGSNKQTMRASVNGRVATLLSRFAPDAVFDAPFESRFRPWYTEHSRTRIRRTMWIAMGILLILMFAGGPFRTLRETVFGTTNSYWIDLLRFGFILPSSVAMLVTSYSFLYQRWFGITASIVAPIYTLSFVAMDILMQPQGYSLSAWMPLAALAPYFLFWMPNAQATCTALAVVIAYALSGHFAGLHGAQRYFDLLVVAFAGMLGAAVHRSLLQSVRHNYLAAQILNESAHRDALTGLYNRRMFDEHLQRLWQQATREHVPVALLLIDLDHFKHYNDHDGHQAGDACLAKVANVLPIASRRPLDLVARYGGEEFAVLLYDVQREKVEEICRQLHAALAKAGIEHPASPVDPFVTMSIGAACVVPGPERRPEGLVQLADEALYTAKEGGRNRTVIMDREYESLVTGAFRTRRHQVA